jgi:transcriptional regulator with XRE-family HTH domain
VALPHSRQPLVRHIKVHDLTYKKVAQALGTNAVRINNLAHGKTYPSPREIDALERLFGLPAEVLLDESLLEYRHSWPPRYADKLGY